MYGWSFSNTECLPGSRSDCCPSEEDFGWVHGENGFLAFAIAGVPTPASEMPAMKSLRLVMIDALDLD